MIFHPLLKYFQWLSVKFSIQTQIFLMAYNILHSVASSCSAMFQICSTQSPGSSLTGHLSLTEAFCITHPHTDPTESPIFMLLNSLCLECCLFPIYSWISAKKKQRKKNQLFGKPLLISALTPPSYHHHHYHSVEQFCFAP